MKRREFIAGLALSAAARPFGASAQHSDRKRRLGVLLTVAPSDPAVAGLWQELIGGLRERGWEEGRNLVIELRVAGRDPTRFDDLAAELAALKVDAILAANPVSIEAARRSSSTIPIIMLGGFNSIGSGWIDSLSRPGHNITGVASDFSTSKHLEILKEAAPGLQRVSVLYSEGNPLARVIDDLRRDAPSFGLIVSPLAVTSTTDLEAEFARLTDQPQALIILGGGPRPAGTSLRHRRVRNPPTFADNHGVKGTCARRSPHVLLNRSSERVSQGSEVCRSRSEGNQSGGIARRAK